MYLSWMNHHPILTASSILDLRATLAFWKSQGKTVIVSEHRLYYLRGLADRFIYITAGKVKRITPQQSLSA